MNNIYNEPGAVTEERHAMNNTEAEIAAGIGTCQMAIATDTGRECHKDHLGALKKSALVTELHSNVNDPTTDQKAALPGTNGTPSASNKYVTDSDPRNTNTRAPTAHASTHNAGGGDVMAIDAAAGTGSLRTLGTAATAACAGNDARLSNARTPTAHASTHNAGGSDAMVIDAAAGTGSLRTLGTAGTAACAGNDSRLSDSRTPVAHAIFGALHTAGPKADLDTKVNDADLISTLPGEVMAMTEKATPLGVDMVLGESIADTNAKRKIAVSNLAYLRPLIFNPQAMTYPNNADWPLNNASPIDLDTAANSIVMRSFDSSTDEGVGFSFELPPNCVSLDFTFWARAGGTGGGNVIMSLYTRETSHNVATPAWSSRYSFTALAFPTNTRYQKITRSVNLSTLGLTAGNRILCELTRYASSGSDTLGSDFILSLLTIKFS
jgi:hypothetical protein